VSEELPNNDPEIPAPDVVKTLLCLANSRKLSGRCVAGREIISGRPGAWIRPVSDREHQEVSHQERRYENGTDPRVLDVIRVPLIVHRPHEYQQENWLLDPRFYWENKGRLNWQQLQPFVQPVGPLWINNGTSYSGLNDRVPIAEAAGLRNSLRLIRVESLTIRVFRPGEAFGNAKRRVQGQFEDRGTRHWLWVTDPVYEGRFLAQPDGCHELGECCLTVSLGEPHEGYAYKLVAAVIERVETEEK
jgi:hypothetical protein